MSCIVVNLKVALHSSCGTIMRERVKALPKGAGLETSLVHEAYDLNYLLSNQRESTGSLCKGYIYSEIYSNAAAAEG